MMDDKPEAHVEFAKSQLKRARYIALTKPKIDAGGELREILSYSHLIPLVLQEQFRVRETLLALWRGYGLDTVRIILSTPNPDSSQLTTLSNLIHDHVPYTLDIHPVLEAVSFALGNDNLFGEEFTDSRLRDAAEIPF